MLKTRIIPTLLYNGNSLVKGVGFDSWRTVGSALPSVTVYNIREVDELVFFDISASKNHTEPDFDLIEDISTECMVPFTVGGGIRDIEHVRFLLQRGADKVSVNSGAYDDPSIINRVSERYGAQCIVSSIDVKKDLDSGKYFCYKIGGQQATGIELTDWVKEVVERGAGEILLTSIDCDGTMNGYDLELIRLVSSMVSIPVIASGGSGSFEHMRLAIQEGGASAVAAASMFHFTEQTPLEAKEYLSKHGIAVRYHLS